MLQRYNILLENFLKLRVEAQSFNWNALSVNFKLYVSFYDKLNVEKLKTAAKDILNSLL